MDLRLAIGVPFVLAGLAALAASVDAVLDTHAHIAASDRAAGKFLHCDYVKYEKLRGRGKLEREFGYRIHPVYEFQEPGGRKHRVRQVEPDQFCHYEHAEAIVVYYRRELSENALIDSFPSLWGRAAFFALLGVPFLLIGSGLATQALRRPKAEGTIIPISSIAKGLLGILMLAVVVSASFALVEIFHLDSLGSMALPDAEPDKRPAVEITSANPEVVEIGKPVTLRAKNLGQPADHEVTIGGHGISVSLNIVSWAKDHIVVTIPPDSRIQTRKSYFFDIKTLKPYQSSNLLGFWFTDAPHLASGAIEPAVVAPALPSPAPPALPPTEPTSPELAHAQIDTVKFYPDDSTGPHVEVVGHEFGEASGRRLAVIGPDFKIYPKISLWNPGVIMFDPTTEPKLAEGGTYLVRIEQIRPPAHGASVAFAYTPAPVPINPAKWAPSLARGNPPITITGANPRNARANGTVTLRGSGFGTRGYQLLVMESAWGREELQVLNWADDHITLRMSREPIRDGLFDPNLRYYYRIERPAAAGTDRSNALAFDFAPDCRMLQLKFRDRCERALAGRDECSTRRTMTEMQHCLESTPDPARRAQCARMPVDRQRAACEAYVRAEDLCIDKSAEAFFDCVEKNMPPNWRDDLFPTPSR